MKKHYSCFLLISFLPFFGIAQEDTLRSVKVLDEVIFKAWQKKDIARLPDLKNSRCICV